MGGGGWGASALFDDMYSYDPVARVWTQLYTDNTPSARYGHGFVFAVGRLWCQGGNGLITQTDDYGDFKHTRNTLNNSVVKDIAFEMSGCLVCVRGCHGLLISRAEALFSQASCRT